MTIVMRQLTIMMLVVLSLSSASSAQQVTFSATPPRSGKLNYKLSMKPGESTTEEVRIFNGSESSLDFRVYTGQAETGPNGSLNGPLFGEPVSGVGTWITPETNRVNLGSRSRKDIKFQVSVPEDAPPGDHVGFVFVDIAPESLAGLNSDSENAEFTQETASFRMKVSTRFALAVVVRVPGEVVADLNIESLSKFVEDGALGLRLKGSNQGNVYLKPSGRWTLYGPTGEVVAQKDRESWGVILSGSDFERVIPLKTDRPLVRGDYELLVETKYAPPDSSEEDIRTLKRRLKITLP